jgi:ubiquinone biosynthesis protein COQ9
METITIKVDQELAKAYQEADQKKQEKVNSILKLFFDPEFTEKSLSQVMAEIAEQAEKRGLTQAILEEILNEEE